MKVVFVKIAMKQRLCWCKKKSIKKYIYRRAVIYFYLKKGLNIIIYLIVSISMINVFILTK